MNDSTRHRLVDGYEWRAQFARDSRRRDGTASYVAVRPMQIGVRAASLTASRQACGVSLERSIQTMGTVSLASDLARSYDLAR